MDVSKVAIRVKGTQPIAIGFNWPVLAYINGESATVEGGRSLEEQSRAYTHLYRPNSDHRGKRENANHGAETFKYGLLIRGLAYQSKYLLNWSQRVAAQSNHNRKQLGDFHNKHKSISAID